MALPQIDITTTNATDGFIHSVTLVIKFSPPITEADLAAWLAHGIFKRPKSSAPPQEDR